MKLWLVKNIVLWSVFDCNCFWAHHVKILTSNRGEDDELDDWDEMMYQIHYQ